MDEYKVFEQAKKWVCKEIENVLDQIEKNGTMSDKDLDRLDKLYHVKKDLLATHGMEHPEEYERESGMSGMRGRASNGQYVSRDGGSSYAYGYSRGYEDGRSQMSGHYPPDWYAGGRW